MPHLSPLNWILVTILFWAMLMLLLSISWWQQSPQMPKMISNKNKKKLFNWS